VLFAQENFAEPGIFPEHKGNTKDNKQ